MRCRCRCIAVVPASSCPSSLEAFTNWRKPICLALFRILGRSPVSSEALRSLWCPFLRLNSIGSKVNMDMARVWLTVHFLSVELESLEILHRWHLGTLPAHSERRFHYHQLSRQGKVIHIREKVRSFPFAVMIAGGKLKPYGARFKHHTCGPAAPIAGLKLAALTIASIVFNPVIGVLNETAQHGVREISVSMDLTFKGVRHP